MGADQPSDPADEWRGFIEDVVVLPVPQEERLQRLDMIELEVMGDGELEQAAREGLYAAIEVARLRLG